MKDFVFVCAIMALSAAQCKKEQPEPVVVDPEPVDTIKPAPVFKDTVFMVRNGSRWVGKVEGFMSTTSKGNRYYLKMVRRTGSAVEERYYLSDMPCKEGAYPIEFANSVEKVFNLIPQSFVTYVVDGDQGGGTYNPDTTRTDSFVKILRYDSLTQIIEGHFKDYLRLKKTDQDLPGLPDTLAMTDGYFKVKLK